MTEEGAGRPARPPHPSWTQDPLTYASGQREVGRWSRAPCAGLGYRSGGPQGLTAQGGEGEEGRPEEPWPFMRSPTSARSKRVWDLHTGRELEELGCPPLTRTPPCPTASTWAVCPALPGRGGGSRWWLSGAGPRGARCRGGARRALGKNRRPPVPGPRTRQGKADDKGALGCVSSKQGIVTATVTQDGEPRTPPSTSYERACGS